MNDARHASIARAMAAAPAAVREYSDPIRAARNGQGTVKNGFAGRYPNLNFQQIILVSHRVSQHRTYRSYKPYRSYSAPAGLSRNEQQPFAPGAKFIERQARMPRQIVIASGVQHQFLGLPSARV